MRYIILLLVVFTVLFTVSCKKKEDHAVDVQLWTLQENFEINDRQSVLYLERAGNIDIIFPWASFMQFGRFDLTDVQSGRIRLRTGVQQSGTIVYDADLGDATAFNYTSLFLGWTNEHAVTHLNITSNPAATVIDTVTSAAIKLFDIVNGVDFQINNWAGMNTLESLTFTLWGAKTVNGVTEYIELMRSPYGAQPETQQFTINFVKSAFSGLSSQEKHNLNWVDNDPDTTRFDINITNSTDTIFDRILSNCANYLFNYRLKMKGTFTENTEVAYIDSCVPNMEQYLSDLLLSYSLSGRARRLIPAGSSLDSAMVLYTNINETLGAMGMLGVNGDRAVYLGAAAGFAAGTGFSPILLGLAAMFGFKADDGYDRLDDYMKTLTGKGMGDFSASLFTRLVLKHSEYLLYAGLCCLYDPVFNSRYFNSLDGMVSEMHNLLNTVHHVFHDNNIVIRFYAAATLYDFMKGTDRGYLRLLEQYYDSKVGPTGEYGEGFQYISYTNDILLPVIYLGVQEHYTWGPNAGQPWLARTSPAVQNCIKNAQSLIGSSCRWGETPAFDDGFSNLQWLAPVAVITDNELFLDHTRHVCNLNQNRVYSSDLIGAFGLPVSVFQLLTYPYNKTFATNGMFSPGDSTSVAGSIVQMHTSNIRAGYSDQISLTLVAEEDPEYGSTHDKLDHGAIQLSRYVDRGSNDVHVNHLIINPGYPSFDENKRYLAEWQFQNQNVLMMYNNEIDSAANLIPAGGDVHYVNNEFNISFDNVFSSRSYGGMSGYKYQSKDDIADMIKGVLFDTKILSRIAAGQSKSFTLLSDAGGKSEVIRKFPNGVQTRIHYEYRFPTVTQVIAPRSSDTTYRVSTTMRSDCKGLREVYNLGNSFYVLDRFPQSERSINNINFATSWNLPLNTDSVRGRPGCYRGFLPDTAIGPVQSRIEIDVKGTLNISDDTIRYRITESMKKEPQQRWYKVKKLTFEQSLSNSDFMITCLNVIDANDTFRNLRTENYNTLNNITTWQKDFTDGSSTIVVYNPNAISNTVNGITTDASLLIIHEDNSGNGSARLFDYSTVAVVGHTIISQAGGQCDISL